MTRAKPTAPARAPRPQRLRAIIFAALTIAAVLAIVLLALRRRAQPADISLSPFPSAPAPIADSIEFDDFVGSERCASCHSAQFATWSNSTHGDALQRVTLTDAKNSTELG